MSKNVLKMRFQRSGHKYATPLGNIKHTNRFLKVLSCHSFSLKLLHRWVLSTLASLGRLSRCLNWQWIFAGSCACFSLLRSMQAILMQSICTIKQKRKKEKQTNQPTKPTKQTKKSCKSESKLDNGMRYTTTIWSIALVLTFYSFHCTY